MEPTIYQTHPCANQRRLWKVLEGYKRLYLAMTFFSSQREANELLRCCGRSTHGEGTKHAASGDGARTDWGRGTQALGTKHSPGCTVQLLPLLARKSRKKRRIHFCFRAGSFPNPSRHSPASRPSVEASTRALTRSNTSRISPFSTCFFRNEIWILVEPMAYRRIVTGAPLAPCPD
jgi:hypothetical protein